MATHNRPTGLMSGTPELRRLEVAMLAAGLAAFGLLYCTQALLPEIGANFGVDPTLSSLTVSAGTGAIAIALLPLSSLAESFGRPTVMRAGLTGACALTLVGAAAPTFWLLVSARALVGVSLAAVVAAAMGHLGEEVHPSAVGTAMGIYVSGTTLGGVSGRLIPGLTQELGSWRIGVVVLGAFAAVSVLAFVVLVPPARRFYPTPLQLTEHVAALRSLWSDRGIRCLCGLGLLLIGGFVACYNYLTYRLTSAPINLSGGLASLLFLAYLAGTVSSTVAGRLAGRLGRRKVISGGILISLAGLALTLPNQLFAITVGLVIFTAGFFAAHSVASAWVATRATSHRAQASALYLMAYYIGSSVLGTLIGLAWLHGKWVATVSVIGVLYLGGLICVIGASEQPGATTS